MALVERGDFGSETSHNSLKILHGGIRYTQHLDVRRLVDSARERRFWLTVAPELTAAQPFVIPLYGHAMKGPEAFGAAALLYNGLTVGIRRGQVPAARVLPRARLAELMPGLDVSAMTGGGAWHDGLIRDANRLLLAVIEDAAAGGGQVANHAAAVDLLGPRDRVEGALVEDRLTGRSLQVRARITVNCAGAGAAGIAARATRHALSPASFPAMARAMNLVVDRQLTAGTGFGLVSRRRSDAVVDRGGRMFFLVPWMGRTMIGTAHLPWTGDADGYRFAEDEVAAFLAEINEAAPALRLARSEVAYCYAGLTPADDEESGGEVRRRKRGDVIDHRATDGVDGLVSVVGIKWTTSRLVAAGVADHVARRLGRGVTGGGAGSAGSLRPLAAATFREDPADDGRARRAVPRRGRGRDGAASRRRDLPPHPPRRDRPRHRGCARRGRGRDGRRARLGRGPPPRRGGRGADAARPPPRSGSHGNPGPGPEPSPFVNGLGVRSSRVKAGRAGSRGGARRVPLNRSYVPIRWSSSRPSFCRGRCGRR